MNRFYHTVEIEYKDKLYNASVVVTHIRENPYFTKWEDVYTAEVDSDIEIYQLFDIHDNLIKDGPLLIEVLKSADAPIHIIEALKAAAIEKSIGRIEYDRSL